MKGRARPVGSLDIRARSGGTAVTLHGEVDEALSRRFEEALTVVTSAGGEVDVDLGDVTFMDAAGLRFLVRLAACRHDHVHVRNVPPFIRMVLEVSHVDEVVDVG